MTTATYRPAVLRPGPAALYLGISRPALYNLFAAGAIPRIQLAGRAVGVRLSDLDAWLQARPVIEATRRVAA